LRCVYRSQDPEDDPNFSKMNPSWEDSLEQNAIEGQGQVESNASLQQVKLQHALDIMANASGGIVIYGSDSIATKRWKNAFLTIKKLLVFSSLYQK